MKNAFEVHPGGTLQGECCIPGDKSISHRGLILGALSEGTTLLQGFLKSEDCLATLEALSQCGVEFTIEAKTVSITGKGLMGLEPPSSRLDCQNSGTSLRLLAGLLSAQSFDSQLIGDDSLSLRPMKRIVEPLMQMGAMIEGKFVGQEVYAPLKIKGKASLQGICYTLPIPSAQVKSCLLLAGLNAKGATTIIEKEPSRDHTERLLAFLGANISRSDNVICLKPGNRLKGQIITIPGDFSSAAFFIAGASFTPGSDIFLRNIGVNPTRTGMISILREMGAEIHLQDEREINAEPVADLEIKGGTLRGIEILPESIVSAIDEFPIIFVAAALAKGTTTIRGIRELRFKETDRIRVMVNALRLLGAQIDEWEDGVSIQGGVLSGGSVDAKGDHRIAMALAMAGLRATGSIKVVGVDNIATSFPEFIALANKSGLTIVKEQ